MYIYILTVLQCTSLLITVYVISISEYHVQATNLKSRTLGSEGFLKEVASITLRNAH